MTATLYRIAGPVAIARNLDAKMYDVVLVGEKKLLGEVIQIQEDKTVIQVYEDTSGLKPGEPVENTGTPLSVDLGPGMLGNIYDGVQRPLPALQEKTGDFITRGTQLPGLSEKEWEFIATCRKKTVSGGEILGHVEEVPGFKHHIMVPPGIEGRIEGLQSGSYSIGQPIASVQTKDGRKEITLNQSWPVRTSRPVGKKSVPGEPLVTGQRIIDTLFPIAKGGTAIIPGPFGAGKTVNQHQLAKWSNADIIIYIGCGERGNEMTDVLTEFPKLKDPRTGAPLMNRTVLIANTSNMPVAAREASIYTGVTIAEYFRDMGYTVAVMADSTSRWAEALREISSRLEEMPGEEGYPAYLASRIAEFYERAGAVQTLGGEESSLTIIGAVSPPGGDFFEPVTQASLRVAKAFWALDSKLAQQRHFPAINWLESYSLYRKSLRRWYGAEIAEDWFDLVGRIGTLLQEEDELLEIVQLVGSDALPEGQQLTLQAAKIIREVLLQQSAFDERDMFSSLRQSYLFMKIIITYYEHSDRKMKEGTKFRDLSEDSIQGIRQFKFSDDPEREAKDLIERFRS